MLRCKKFLCVLSMVSFSSVSFASTDITPTSKNELAVMSGMPPKPTIIGIRHYFHGKLGELRDGVEQWMNPNAEWYLYRNHRSLAPDSSLEIKAHVALYERILKDYWELIRAGTIDQYRTISVTGGFTDPEERLPNKYKLPLNIADMVRSHSFQTNYILNEFLSKLGKEFVENQGWDSFFATEANTKKLRSLSDLASSNLRTNGLIQQMIGHYSARINDIGVKMSEQALIALSLDVDSPNFDEEAWEVMGNIDRLDGESVKIRHDLEILTKSIYGASKFSNAVLSDKSKNLEDLESTMARLGDLLAMSIADINQFYVDLQTGRSRQSPVKINREADELLDVYHLLTRILGLDNTFTIGTTFPDHLRGEAVQVVRDTLIFQHVMTAGSIMSKVQQTKEGKTSLSERLLQEFQFAKAKLGFSNPKSSDNALVVSNETPEVSLEIKRENFLSTEVKQRRENIEEKLWKIFFEHAKLEGSDANDCEQPLLP